MAKSDKRDPQPKYVDPETGELREVGEGESPKRSGLVDALKRAASDAVVRRTSTKR
ncbi:MAG: hypothetical protein JJE35_02325 [Thermoleophilia bacterium]|nr:hypothetical protein [Thermoleophilia bacterium]